VPSVDQMSPKTNVRISVDRLNSFFSSRMDSVIPL
jgi:hypothetical protein